MREHGPIFVANGVSTRSIQRYPQVGRRLHCECQQRGKTPRSVRITPLFPLVLRLALSLCQSHQKPVSALRVPEPFLLGLGSKRRETL